MGARATTIKHSRAAKMVLVPETLRKHVSARLLRLKQRKSCLRKCDTNRNRGSRGPRVIGELGERKPGSNEYVSSCTKSEGCLCQQAEMPKNLLLAETVSDLLFSDIAATLYPQLVCRESRKKKVRQFTQCVGEAFGTIGHQASCRIPRHRTLEVVLNRKQQLQLRFRGNSRFKTSYNGRLLKKR